MKVVEELLSKSGAMGLEAAKAIADAAMLEVASTNVPNMVTQRWCEETKGLVGSLCQIVTVSLRLLRRRQTSSTKESHLSISSRFDLLMKNKTKPLCAVFG